MASHRGVKGGYVLQRTADEVSLAELMEALDDSFHLAECTKESDVHVCTFTHVCPVRGAIGEVHRRIREVLRSVTLAELFGQPVDGCTQVGLNLSSMEKQLVALGDMN